MPAVAVTVNGYAVHAVEVTKALPISVPPTETRMCGQTPAATEPLAVTTMVA